MNWSRLGRRIWAAVLMAIMAEIVESLTASVYRSDSDELD